jgi:RimJ/RimL family protein N-acetyltransferase
MRSSGRGIDAVIETERLILRRWRNTDRAPFHAMGRDPEVMRYLGPLQTRAETDVAIDRQNALLDSTGHCFWAIERRGDGAFIGFCGLKPGPERTPIAGDIEIGWRLLRDAWGQGYAREAAAASLDWGWANLSVAQIAAITVLANTRSWGLMERLGMVRDATGDFDHPALLEGDALRRHLTYRIARSRPRGD